MRNITFSADAGLIEKARAVARSQRRTLNDAFREWLGDYAARDREIAAQRFRDLMQDLRHIDAGAHFTRDEMNER
jgi:hypothetical protein